MPTTAGA